MSISTSLDRLHARARTSPFLYRFALGTRLMLAAGFVPTGMVKLLGLPFTRMNPETDVGKLFDALYQGGGLYWHFLGGVQVLAGLLILIPMTSTVGAVLFFPFILNIFVITVSYRFTGTPFITGPMVLASLFLLCWDYHRLRAIVFPGRYGEGQPALPAPVESLGTRWEPAVYWLGGVTGLVFFLSMRFPVIPDVMARVAFPLAAAAALAAAGGAVRSLVGARPAAA
jgi:uncharacterized membrane protein YphA (DoxX/SURF4 family)